MIFEFAIIVLLVMLSACFSGMETAVFSLGEIDLISLEKKGTRASRGLLKLIKNRVQVLSAILIGNNLMNISVSAYTTTVALKFAERETLAPEITVTVFAGALTIFLIIFGEIIPKNIAYQFNRQIALFGFPLLAGVFFLLYPICSLFSLINRFFMKIFKTEVHRITDEILLKILRRGAKEGNIEVHEKEFVENVMVLADKTISSVMTPRVSVFALDEEMTLREAIAPIREKKFSRIPVYEESIDNITGIVDLRTVLSAVLEQKQDLPLKKFARKPLFLYETQKIHAAIERLRISGTHFAVVVDEFGGINGIITLEDMIEEIVGEIFDEKDIPEKSIKKSGENSWIMPGRIDIHLFNKETNSELNTDEEYETLQGLLMYLLEKIPNVGDSVRYGRFFFKILRMRNNEIASVQVELEPDPEAPEGEETSEI